MWYSGTKKYCDHIATRDLYDSASYTIKRAGGAIIPACQNKWGSHIMSHNNTEQIWLRDPGRYMSKLSLKGLILWALLLSQRQTRLRWSLVLHKWCSFPLSLQISALKTSRGTWKIQKRPLFSFYAKVSFYRGRLNFSVRDVATF